MISLKEAIYQAMRQTGGGSAELRYRLGVELGHIEPAPAPPEHPYWCDCEYCLSEVG
jgi:hypothetical protein